MPPNVEHVVDDLKSDAQKTSVAYQRLLRLGGGAAEMGPQAAATSAQFRGFCRHNVQVFLLAQVIAPPSPYLAKLPLAHDPRGIADRARYVDIGKRRGHANRSGEEVIAQEHARLVAPSGIDRLQMAAEIRLVQHVVVDQRRRVDQLQDRRRHEVIAIQAAGGQSGQEHQGRAEPLSAELEAVLRQSIDERKTAADFSPQEVLHLVQFLANGRVHKTQSLRRGLGVARPLNHQCSLDRGMASSSNESLIPPLSVPHFAPEMHWFSAKRLPLPWDVFCPMKSDLRTPQSYTNRNRLFRSRRNCHK